MSSEIQILLDKNLKPEYVATCSDSYREKRAMRPRITHVWSDDLGLESERTPENAVATILWDSGRSPLVRVNGESMSWSKCNSLIRALRLAMEEAYGRPE